jgi:hypothetical protein
LFRFQGVSGEVVLIRTVDQSSAANCVLELIRPNGSLAALDTGTFVCEISQPLDANGLFTVRVSETLHDAVMPYSLQVDRLTPSSIVASINPDETITSSTIDPAGDTDLYLFNGVSGDTITLTLIDVSGSGPDPSCVLEIYRPDGSLANIAANTSVCVINTTLNQTGVFTIRAREAGDDQLLTYDLRYQCVVGSCPSFHPLSVQRAGAGTVTSSPAGITCRADCFERYASGTVVTLTAIPDSGAVFLGWSGDPDCADGIVTMSAARGCTATFSVSNLAPTAVDDSFSTPVNTPLVVPLPGVLSNDNSNGGGT